MAIYKGNYINDFNRVTFFTSLMVTSIDISDNSPINSNTSYEFDLNYLPLIYIENVTRIKPNERLCNPNLIKRYAKLYLSAVEYLKVELPFSGNNSEFEIFISQANNNARIISIGLEGEKINNYFVKLFVF